MNKLIEGFNDLELVKRIKVLEEFLDKDLILSEKIAYLKSKQKQMVNAKEFDQWKQYAIYKKEYDALYNEIVEYPFVGEYLDLLNEANDILKNITNIIEKEINNYLEK